MRNTKVVELYGKRAKDIQDITSLLASQHCPYTCKRCVKMRKSTSEITIGTCVVRHQGKPMIICPYRMLERQKVFLDCVHLLKSHEPGNDLYVIPEIQIPGGNVDYFLVSARNGKVVDFVGIEFQTLDTTGTLWPERQLFINEFTENKELVEDKTCAINWKMSAKTILVQLHHKVATFSAINRHLVLVIQTPFWNYINNTFDTTSVRRPTLADVLHIHAYSLEESNYTLALLDRASTDEEGVAQLLGLGVAAQVEFEKIRNILEEKLSDKYLLRIY